MKVCNLVNLICGYAKFYDFGSMAILTSQLFSTRSTVAIRVLFLSSVGALRRDSHAETTQRRWTEPGSGTLFVQISNKVLSHILTFPCWLLVQIRIQALYPTTLSPRKHAILALLAPVFIFFIFFFRFFHVAPLFCEKKSWNSHVFFRYVFFEKSGKIFLA